jgi:hypothetical protein
MIGVMGKKKKGSRHVDRHMLSFPHDVYEALRKAAQRNGRPLVWEARLRLRKSLEAEGEIPPESGKPPKN